MGIEPTTATYTVRRQYLLLFKVDTAYTPLRDICIYKHYLVMIRSKEEVVNLFDKSSYLWDEKV